MTYLSTKGVIDRVFTRIKDNSATLRVKMLAWLNSAMQDVVNERAWLFLEKTVTLPLVGSSVTLPTDFGRETFIKVGTSCLTVGDRLTPEEAEQVDDAGGEPFGYTVGPTTITIHPSTTGTLDLTYTAAFSELEDSTDNTLFPSEFLPLFERYLLTCFYEYDVDESRWGAAARLDQKQLSTLKRLDNARKPLPQLNYKGMTRG